MNTRQHFLAISLCICILFACCLSSGVDACDAGGPYTLECTSQGYRAELVGRYDGDKMGVTYQWSVLPGVNNTDITDASSIISPQFLTSALLMKTPTCYAEIEVELAVLNAGGK